MWHALLPNAVAPLSSQISSHGFRRTAESARVSQAWAPSRAPFVGWHLNGEPPYCAPPLFGILLGPGVALCCRLNC